MPRTALILCLLLFTPTAGPAAGDDPCGGVAQEAVRSEVARLLEQLDSDGYETRCDAAARLEQLIDRPELGRLLAIEFQRALRRPEVSFEVRWHLTRWSRRLPKVLPEPAKELSTEQIERLMQELDDDRYAVRLAAVQRLKELLNCDEHVPPLKRAMQSRLEGALDAAAALQLRKLLELTRPAMVAEYWQGGRHRAEQHLIIGVPSMSEGAKRPSHFDRIDDRVAHCVSGSNLSPGDYPVGVAIPHPNPNQSGAFFHLVNLSTPGKRMAYAVEVQTDEAQRLAALSRRTLDRMLAEKRELSEPELVMLSQLDAKEVSRFAGQYFHLVRDKQLSSPAPATGAYQHTDRPSRFGAICAQLASKGTKEAAPGLLEAIDKGRFLPPTSTAPYRFHWMAALAIALRDPWPQLDAWLAEKIPNTEVLVEGRPNGPELGATAAAMLLKRFGQSPSQFGLQSAAEPMLMRLGVNGYRYSSKQSPTKVQQWWQKQSSESPGLQRSPASTEQ